jgi:uncharacterized protein YkwD
MKANAKFQMLSGSLVAVISAFLLAGATAPAAHAGSACARGDAAPQKLGSKKAARTVMCLVNRKRRQHGLGRLDRDRRLQRAAKRHNRVMVRRNCFSHQCPGEAGLDGRLHRVGYLGGGLSRWAYGENIAWGGGRLGTPKKIVDAWMGSPPHRAAILSRTYREAGVGFHAKAPSKVNTPSGTYTIDFGLRIR